MRQLTLTPPRPRAALPTVERNTRRTTERRTERWTSPLGEVELTVQRVASLDDAAALARLLLAWVAEACDSEQADGGLARVNAAQGRRVRVDPLLVAAIEFALGASAAAPEVELDPAGAVRLAAGMVVDLASTLPAFTADFLACELATVLGCAVNVRVR